MIAKNSIAGFCCSCCALLLMAGAPLHAQDRDPSGFFDRDYIQKHPEAAATPAKDAGSKNGPGKKKQAGAAEGKPGGGEGFAELSAPDAEATVPAVVPANRSATAGLAMNKPGMKVLWVSAIINALDKQHLAKAYEELSNAVKTAHFKIGPIYLIGSQYLYSDEEKADIEKRFNISIQNFRETVPDNLAGQINRSPTWVVQTDQDGQYVLEAIGPLSDYFNEKGEFVDLSKHK